MNERLSDSIELATISHAGQLDKTGHPAIFHPLRVMMSLFDETHQIVGVLHDVVEDSSTTVEDIRQEFGDEIADAVDAISHRDNEPNTEYAERIRQNNIAKIVKLSDIRDNMSPYRMNGLSIADQRRMIKKYEKLRTLIRK